MAGADVLAPGTVHGVVPAGPPLAPLSRPSLGAGARAVHGVAGAAVLALARGGAVQAELAVGALLLTL